jgi:hypothetical protein
MKILNLDKIVSKRDTVIILDGVEHAMHVPTVKDYVDQMRKAEEITAAGSMDNPDTAVRMFDLTIETLMKSFPTIKREQFESLTLDQLTSIRELAEDATSNEMDSEEGGATGKAD